MLLAEESLCREMQRLYEQKWQKFLFEKLMMKFKRAMVIMTMRNLGHARLTLGARIIAK